mgnify:CR=1 FL=1
MGLVLKPIWNHSKNTECKCNCGQLPLLKALSQSQKTNSLKINKKNKTEVSLEKIR